MAPATTLDTFTNGTTTVVMAVPVREAVRIGSLRCDCCGLSDVWADAYGVHADCPNTETEPWLPV